MKKKLILFLAILSVLACVLAVSVSAASCEVGGVYYDLNDSNNTATVNRTNRTDCTLERVIIPETINYGEKTYTVTGIYDRSFGHQDAGAGNTYIKYVELPATITNVDQAQLFRNCTSLEEVKLRGSATTISAGMFWNCTALKKIDLSEVKNLTSIGGQATSACPNLEEVVLPPTVTSIGHRAFQSATKLKVMVLPNGLTSISINAIQSTGLEYLVLPASLTTVDNAAFNSTSKIQVIVFAGKDLTNYHSDAFYGTGASLVFYAGDDPTVFSKFSTLKNITNYVTYAQYLEDIKNPEFTGYASKTIVYGTSNTSCCGDVATNVKAVEGSTCLAECGNCKAKTYLANPVHQYVFTETFAGTRFFSSVNLSSVCEDCETVEFDETLSAPFNWVGYSAKTFGDAKGFGQQYVINQSALTRYMEIMASQGVTVTYGVVAAGTSSAGQPLEIVDGVVTDKEGAESICFNQIKYDAFFMNITGIDNANLDANLVCCAYVQLGEEIVYLDDNQAKDTAGFLTYNMIAMPETKEDEE